MRTNTLVVIVLIGLIALAVGGYEWLAIGLCESGCASGTARSVWGTIATAGALSAGLAISALVVRAFERAAQRRAAARNR